MDTSTSKIFTGLMYKLLLSFMVISNIYRSFIPNKATFTKYCLSQWISKFHGSSVWQYLVHFYYNGIIVGAMASQITSLTIVYSTIYSGLNQRKHQSSASLAFVWGIHRWTVNSPCKGPVTRKMFPFDDIIMHGSGGHSKHNCLQDRANFHRSRA